MNRLFTSELLLWKNKENRKPLIVRGARQVGKSYTISEFGKNHFKGNTHIINLEKQKDWHIIFEKNLDAKRIVAELELLVGMPIVPSNDLVFFDEIQECPNAIISLRYFYEQLPKLHVIAAGSLLEFSLNNIPFPVGRVQILNMYPMNFFEFLEATGNNLLAKQILTVPKKLPDSIHNKLLAEVRNYFLVGGMPESVKVFANSRSFTKSFEVQSDLIETFKQDFFKYAGRADKDCLNVVLSTIPKRIGGQIKYSELATGYSNPTIKKAFELLETARLFKKVHSTSPAGLPLGASVLNKKFKAIFVDIGLFVRLSGISNPDEFLKSNLLSIFRGSLAEQFVGQELVSAGNDELFYWSREVKSSNAEVDFLVKKNEQIIPIEVKSGSAGSLKSLKILLDTYKNVEEAFIFSEALYGKILEQKFVFIPIYYTYSASKAIIQ